MSICLCLAGVASACLFRALHENVLLHDLSISLVRQLFALIRNLHLLRDDTQAFRAVHSRVLDLCLERQVSDGSHVDVFHLEKLRDGLHSIIKCEHCVGCDVAKSASQDRLIS